LFVLGESFPEDAIIQFPRSIRCSGIEARYTRVDPELRELEEEKERLKKIICTHEKIMLTKRFQVGLRYGY
jgi:hypothetical protein